LEQIATDRRFGEEYRPDWPALRRLLGQLGLTGSGIDVEHLAALSWSSYVAGMRIPGRPALISALTLDCRGDAPADAVDGGFAASATVADADPRFRRLRLAGEVSAGTLAARVEIVQFVRRETTEPSPDLLRDLLSGHRADGADPGALAGRVAFVAGGSRGLGAALVQALALAGCTVHAGFRHSRAEAGALVAALGRAGMPAGRVRLEQGDAADVAWCGEVRDRIAAEHGRIDIVVLNACPPLENLPVAADFAARSVDHVRRALELVQAPLAAFAAAVAAETGWVVAVSSAAVRAPVPGWAPYVTAKHAVEGLIRTAAAEHSRARFLIARPPRLRTTFVDAPAGAAAVPVEPVAAAIVRRLIEEDAGTGTGAAGGSVVVEDFAGSRDGGGRAGAAGSGAEAGHP
ncbi:SDR family NAD(P)-dependent oxidoreductase, partial [Streptomyces sp. NPDC055078]